MNHINSRRLMTALGVSVAVAIGASSMSSAQPTPRPLPGNPAYNQDRGGPPDRRDDSQYNRREDRLERRLDYLRSELKITPAQQRLWDDFANVVRQTAERGPVRAPGFDRDRNGDRGPQDNRGGQYRGRDNGPLDAPGVLRLCGRSMPHCRRIKSGRRTASCSSRGTAEMVVAGSRSSTGGAIGSSTIVSIVKPDHR